MVRVLTETDIGEIVKLRGLGYSQKEIAERLGVSPATISYQLNRINEIAKRDGDDKTLLAFLFGAGLGLLVESILQSGSSNQQNKRR
jgi:transcriptional regulator with XRE-family HTH domain